jgi:SAM-dependent methyltransferase
MESAGSDKVFAGSIPKIYDTYLVPLLFEAYALDLASRVAALRPDGVLEIACGTGVVTRAMAAALPERVSIVATDLNPPMIDHARERSMHRPVEWRPADALDLPFEAGSFDAVVCQFGVMFFPDKARAFAEARRVLRPGGTLLFNVWDRLEENEPSRTATAALATLFPEDPPRFFERTPHGYHDRATIERDLAAGGFTAPPGITVLPARGRAASARDAAIAICQGTPLRAEIEARGAGRLGEATEVAAEAIARSFGGGAIDTTLQAIVVEVAR